MWRHLSFIALSQTSKSAAAFEGTCNTVMFVFYIESQELTDALCFIYAYIYIYIYIYMCVCVCVKATNVNWEFAWRSNIYKMEMWLFDIWLLRYPVIWNDRCCIVVDFTRSNFLATMMSRLKHICCGLIKCILTQNFPDKYHISIYVSTFNSISITLSMYTYKRFYHHSIWFKNTNEISC